MLGFDQNGINWIGDPDVSDTLVAAYADDGSVTGWTYTTRDGNQEYYNASGQLTSLVQRGGLTQVLAYNSNGQLASVTDPQDRSITFAYDANGRIQQMTAPDGEIYGFSYDANDNLQTITYPDTHTLQLIHGENDGKTNFAGVNDLTGVIDEGGVRIDTTLYNSSDQVTLNEGAGGVNATTFSYTSSNGSVTDTVTDPLGMAEKTTTQYLFGIAVPMTITHTCTGCVNASRQYTYDANGYTSSFTDFNNNLTTTIYDANGLLDQQVDASGTTSQRTTNTTWNTTLRVPLTQTVLNAAGTALASTGWVYNAAGQTLARCEIDPSNSAASGYTCNATGTVPAGVRRWTYTYCTTVGTGCPLVGLMLTATGPRTDLTQTTTYSYYTSSSATSCGTPGAACYQPGDLYQVTDPLGHVTTIASYDGDGRVTRITDANGVNTDLTYTPRGWLASRTVGGVTTSLTYTPYGAVASVTDPDNVTTSYTYDAAHRLTRITDALGNYVQYTLDAAGNKTAEQTYDSSGTVHKSLSRTFNTLGQLTAVVDGLNNTVFNAGSTGSYDANGNLVQSTDALGFQRKLGYDALNRLVSTLDNYNGTDSATQNTATGYSYDSLDRLTQVTDPSSLNTTYSYDGLSDATGQQSPDTGATSRTFDAAGNVLTRTDARGITATSSYDARNRLTAVSYPDTTQNITYSYDQPNSVTGCSSSSPVGRLTTIVEATVATVYCYDARGNVTTKSQVTGTATDSTAYTYTAGNRLSGITYPSGSQVSYGFDGDGRIQTVSLTPVNGSGVTAVSSVTYQPFGPISSYTLGNGQTVTRSYDANYRLTDLTSPALNLHFARDAMGDITALGNAPGASPATETYAYDPLYRLTTITEAGGTVLESATYNPTGDRTSKSGSGLATGTYSYNPNTHQLVATGNAVRSVDADGNTTAIAQAGAAYGFGYNDRNRLAVAQISGGTVGSYSYNALGQRIGKSAASTERFVYGEGSRLLSEYGTDNRDYVWLGNIPVANVDTTGTASTISYITADQLGTPRAVADSSGNTAWQWAYQGNPWGEQQPTSTTGYVLNLRYPGQYYDAETGMVSNGMRDCYEPATGRYCQSDPTGLHGGISTYAYALNNPINAFDSNGLKVTWYARPTQITGPFSFVNDLGITHQWIRTDTEEAGMGPAGGGVPGQGEPPDAPFTNVGTIDHTGQSNQPGAYSIPLPDDMDESCVNEMINPGRDLGKFIPGVNDCHTFVQQVISHCRLHKPLRLMPTL